MTICWGHRPKFFPLPPTLLKVFGRVFYKKLVGFKGAMPLCQGFRGETPSIPSLYEGGDL